MKCISCGNNNLSTCQIKSYMRDYPNIYGKSWEYMFCNKCGLYAIKRKPDENELVKLYSGYYSLSAENMEKNLLDKLFDAKLKYQLTGKQYIGWLVDHIYPYEDYSFIADINKTKQNKTKINVLDVGSGEGELLSKIAEMLKENARLVGIDPFLREPYIIKEDGVELLRIDLINYDCYEGCYDLIMFNHSFDHIYEQKESLLKAYKLLKPNGILTIGTPVFNMELEKYWGMTLESIHPPYQFYIHSLKSLLMLIESCGFKMCKVSTTLSPMQPSFYDKVKKGIKIEDWCNSAWDYFSCLILKSYILRKFKRENNGNIARVVCIKN